MGTRITASTEDQLPKPRPAGWPRQNWPEVFERIAAEHPRGGVAVKVAEFDGRWSATRIKRKVVVGEIEVPGGLDAWEIVAVARTNSKGVVTGSELHAEFAGWAEE